MTTPYSRHRVLTAETETTTGNLVYSGTRWNTGQVDILGYPTSAITYQRKLETIDDVVTPDFRARMAKGEIINSPLTHYTLEQDLHAAELSHVFRETRPGYGTYEFWTYEGTEAWDFFTKLPTPDDDWGDEEADRLSRFEWTKAKAKDLAEVDMLTTLGELKETVMMFVMAYQKLAKITWSLRRKWGPMFRAAASGNCVAWERLDRALKRAYSRHDWGQMYQDLWLTWRYGIRPLIFEVQGYIDFLNGKALKGVERWTARSRAKAKVYRSAETTTLSLYPTAGMNLQVFSQCTWAVEASGGVLYQLEMINLAIRLGLTPDKIPSTAWELTKLSFVFDWFINIGPVISALTPHAGIRELASWRSYRSTLTRELWCIKADGGPPVSIPYRISEPFWAPRRLAFSKETKKVRIPAHLSNSLIFGIRPDIKLGYAKIADLALISLQAIR